MANPVFERKKKPTKWKRLIMKRFRVRHTDPLAAIASVIRIKIEIPKYGKTYGA